MLSCHLTVVSTLRLTDGENLTNNLEDLILFMRNYVLRFLMNAWDPKKETYFNKDIKNRKNKFNKNQVVEQAVYNYYSHDSWLY